MITTFDPNSVSAPPDHVADYRNAFKAGRALATGGVGGGPDRDAIQRRAELFAALGRALLGRPYAERRAVLAHLAPALIREGLSRLDIDRFDPTDRAISQSIERARSLGESFQAGEAA